MAKQFTDANFQNEVLDHSGVVIVDFWAPWCGPCRTVGPVIEEIAAEYSDKIKVGKVNVDENPETASKYGIMSIPTILVLNQGQVIDTIIGAVPKEEIVQKINQITA